MNTALLVVDIQNDYFPGGRMELCGSIEAAERAASLIARFRERRLPVIFIQHVATKPTATFFLPGTDGVAIHTTVAPLAGERIIQKHFPNSFRQTALLDELRSRSIGHLVIVGMMTHMCIDATTRAACDFGLECTVAADACATRDLTLDGRVVAADQVHHAFLAALDGTYARVRKADEIASSL